MHSFGIIIKEKCSPFNSGIIQQPIMSINKVITQNFPSFIFDFDIVNFPFLNGDVPRRASYEYVLQSALRLT